MNNRLTLLWLGLFLVYSLGIFGTTPIYAVTGEQPTPPPSLPPPPNPYDEEWRPPTLSDYESRNFWDVFKLVDRRTSPGKDTIGTVYFLNKKGQRLDVSTDITIATDDEVALVIQVNTGGRLYLCTYPPINPSENIPQGIWLIFNEVSLSKAGTYQTTSFKKLSDIAGKHLYRLWFYDNSNNWSQKRVSFNLITEPKSTSGTVRQVSSPPTQPTSDNRVKPPVINSFGPPVKTTIGEGISRVTAWRLSWDVSDATRITISTNNPNVPPLIFEAKSDPKQITVTPRETTTYTLTAENEAGTALSVSVTITPDSTTGLPLPLLATATGVVIVIAGAVAGFLIKRRGAQPLPPPPSPKKKAKFLLPNNMELPIEAGEKWLGRIDFVRVLSPPDLKSISRHHFLISYADGRFSIEDSTSDNGTKVNDVEIRGRGKQELQDGDHVTIAEVITITFKALPPPAKTPA